MFKAMTSAAVIALFLVMAAVLTADSADPVKLDPDEVQIAKIVSVSGDTVYMDQGLEDGIGPDWRVKIFNFKHDEEDTDTALILCADTISACVVPVPDYPATLLERFFKIYLYNPAYYELDFLNLAYPFKPDTVKESIKDFYGREFYSLAGGVYFFRDPRCSLMPRSFLKMEYPPRTTPVENYDNWYGSPYEIDSFLDSLITLTPTVIETPWDKMPDTVRIHIIPEYLDRKIAFQTGEIDLLDLHFSDVDQFSRDYRVIMGKTSEVAYLSVNNIKDFMSDGRFAAALSYLINKDALCRVALAGSADPVDNLIPDWIMGARYDYDPSKGRTLLRDFKRPLKYISLFVSVDDFKLRRTAEYIKGLLEREGIYATIYYGDESLRNLEYNQFQQFDLMLSYINLTDDSMDILDQMTFHYNLDDITDNRSLYFSPEHDSISVFVETTCDDFFGLEAMQEYYQTLCEHPAGIPLFQPIRQAAVSERIKSIGFTADGYIDYSNVEITHESEK